VVLVLNKVDLLKNKAAMLPLLEAFGALRDFAAVVPISALRTGKGGVARVLEEVARLCPEGPHRHAEDEITDRPVRFFAAEYVREQILRATKEEVPHAVAVEVTEFTEPGSAAAAKGAVVRIEATIHVERPGQKKILVGARAEMLKRIGTAARKRIEELLGRRVHLGLFVRVTADWRDSPQQLAELGYQTPRSKGGAAAGSADDTERDAS
jgi:GTP-binding protein Era